MSSPDISAPQATKQKRSAIIVSLLDPFYIDSHVDALADFSFLGREQQCAGSSDSARSRP